MCAVAEVAPGIWRATVGMGAHGTVPTMNCYLVRGGDEALLVDTAWWEGTGPGHLEQLIDTAGRPKVSMVVLTHFHRDHSGYLDHAVALTGATPVLHTAEAGGMATLAGWEGLADHAALTAWYAGFGVPASTAAAIAARRAPQRPADISAARWVTDGAELRVGPRRLRVLHTPGHSDGSLCLLDTGTGTLLLGDTLLPRGAGNAHVTVRPGTIPDPIGAHLGAVARLAALEITRALPGHGEMVDGGLGALAAEHRDRMGRKLVDTEKVLAAGPCTAYEVADGLRWHRDRLPFSALEPEAQFLAFGDTLARLRHLVAQGRAGVDQGQRFDLSCRRRGD